MSQKGQQPGARWQTTARTGLSHREAGRSGGRARHYEPPRPAETRQEVVARWFLGEATQAALAAEYGLARSTVRRWCAQEEERDGCDRS